MGFHTKLVLWECRLHGLESRAKSLGIMGRAWGLAFRVSGWARHSAGLSVQIHVTWRPKRAARRRRFLDAQYRAHAQPAPKLQCEKA